VARRSALHLFGALGTRPKPNPVEIVTQTAPSRRPRLGAHRGGLTGDETTVREGIPTTTAARAMIDLAGSIDPDALEYLLAQAFAARATSRTELVRHLDRRCGEAGTRVLSELLDAYRAGEVHSPPELQLLRLLRAAKLTPVRANAKVSGWEVDFFWKEERVIVEVDVLSTHSHPRAFERDRLKDAELMLAGYAVVRVTRRQIEREPQAVIARIAGALARAAATGSPAL
jgi:very-short-patch-repair endonuclease